MARSLPGGEPSADATWPDGGVYTSLCSQVQALERVASAFLPEEPYVLPAAHDTAAQLLVLSYLVHEGPEMLTDVNARRDLLILPPPR